MREGSGNDLEVKMDLRSQSIIDHSHTHKRGKQNNGKYKLNGVHKACELIHFIRGFTDIEKSCGLRSTTATVVGGLTVQTVAGKGPQGEQ